jgi:hypothetical protein
VRAVTDVYDQQISFEEKCDALQAQIDKGDVPSPLALARALELPLSYVQAAIAISTLEFVRHNTRRKRGAA